MRIRMKRQLVVFSLFLFAFGGSATAQESDLAKALAVCQKDPEPKARIACYEAVKEIQALRENPLLNALTGRDQGSATAKNNSRREKPKKNSQQEFAESAISAKLIGKKFRGADFSSGRVQDFLNLQLEFKAEGLKKPARAVKGVVVFSDLFEEEKLRISWTLDDPLSPGQVVRHLDSGIRPNQFMADHQWLRNTETEDIAVTFRVRNILYADGTKWSYSN